MVVYKWSFTLLVDYNLYVANVLLPAITAAVY